MVLHPPGRAGRWTRPARPGASDRTPPGTGPPPHSRSDHQ